LAVRGGRSWDDGTLLEVTRVLASVDTSKDDGASVAVHGADIKREGSALDEVLSGHAVNNKRIRGVPAVQVRSHTHDTNTHDGGVVGNAKELLLDMGS
jgi:hypothetical protein